MSRTSLASIVSSSVIAGGLAIASAPLAAQRQSPPSVTVVTFEGNGAPQDAREAMADELAARLVDTGHFRVLHREWLPHDGSEAPEIETLRAAAHSVNVDYLVLGSIRQSTATAVPNTHVLTAYGPGQPFSRGIVLRRPAPVARAQKQTTIAVTVRVIDVVTDDVVRTASAQRIYSSNSSPAPMLVPPAAPSPALAAALAAQAVRAKSSASRLTKDWRTVVQQVAQQLDARGVPARASR
jgi:hypothetical protein